MLKLRHSQQQRHGLGVWVNRQGLALSQTAHGADACSRHPSCYWQAVPGSNTNERPWPDPQLLRVAKQRSGFQGLYAAMALPPDQLLRFSFAIPHGLNQRQTHGRIQDQLAPLLPWSLADTLWDYQVIQGAKSDPTQVHTINRPAWLNAALQAQPAQHADVIAMPKHYAHECEQWCSKGGLKLVKLEPVWQASMRWQLHIQSSPVGVLQETALAEPSSLTTEELATLYGLALGVVTP